MLLYLPYPEHPARNKQYSFKDVGCLDATRVKLLNRPASDDYVHANYVSTPTCTRRFICTQAPLESTCKDFWQMCIQDRVEYIVMLCNFFEKVCPSCFPVT
ncbi:hypothetical protein OESDEN_07126 [Oesophagostomum dentatum]|uniref:Tyrosine-protein phosphatase domain-containing protein n=1 Tax=Oesophagostomum dentatum TaxID=61180 RepID=A0A0B1T5V8_OESDE|nr:hypothetical protein OESDEN_07126 [Oesophagostomum dentatum]